MRFIILCLKKIEKFVDEQINGYAWKIQICFRLKV